MKIKCCQQLINEKDSRIRQLEIDVVGLNERYKNTYNYKLWNWKNYLDKEYQRVEILNRIDNKNKDINNLRNSLDKFKNMYKLLYNCYYFVDKAKY